MKKRVVQVGIFLALGLVLWFSPLPYSVQGYLNHEPFFRGMPACFWGKKLSNDVPFLPAVAEKILPPTLLTRTATGTLSDGGRPAIPVLVELLKHENDNTRYNTVYALCLMGPDAEDAIPRIIELLETEPSSNWHILSSAASFLGGKGPKARAAVPALCELLKNPSSHARQAAAIALGEIDPESRPAVLGLIELLKDEDFVVRYYGAQALGQMGSAASEAVPALTDLLEDEDSYVRASAAEALWKLTHRVNLVLAALIEIVQKHEAKLDAIRVLALLGKDATPAIPALRDSLNDRYESVRRAAAAALRHLDPEFTGER